MTTMIIGATTALGQAVAQQTNGTVISVPESFDTLQQLQQMIDEVKSQHTHIDTLYFCAYDMPSKQLTLLDHFEESFFRQYITRFLWLYSMAPLLANSDTPLVISFHPNGGDERLNFHDIELRNSYTQKLAAKHIPRLLDLALLHFHEKFDTIRTVAFDPGAIKEEQNFLMKLHAISAQDAVQHAQRFVETHTGNMLIGNTKGAVDITTHAYHPGKAYELYMETHRKLTIRKQQGV